MKIKIIIAGFCLLMATGVIYAQTGSFTTSVTNGVTIVQGSYWAFIYNDTAVAEPVFHVVNGETKTQKLLFAGNTEQECYNRITVLFGQQEADRVRNLYSIQQAPDAPIPPVPPVPPPDTIGLPLNNNQ